MGFGSLQCANVVGSVIIPNVPLWWGMLMVGESVHVGDQKVYGNSVLSTALCWESKMALNNKFYKSDLKSKKNFRQA